MPYLPTPLQVPAGHAIREVSSFTPQGLLLGTAFDSQAGTGLQYETVTRWSPNGTCTTLAGRMRNIHGRVVGTDDGLVVLSAAFDHDGLPKPLAIVGGVVRDLGSAYPGGTVIARMNATGTFVGTTDSGGRKFGFVATLTGMRPVVTPDPSAESSANIITDDGDVYGTWSPGPGAPRRGFLERNGVAEDLREFLLFAVNTAQLGVGRLSNQPEFALGTFDLRQRPLAYRPVPLPAGQEFMTGPDLDDAGNVAAYCWKGSPAITPYRGFIASGASSELLDALLGLPGQLVRVTAVSRGGSLAGSLGASHYIAHPTAQQQTAAPDPRRSVRTILRR